MDKKAKQTKEELQKEASQLIKKTSGQCIGLRSCWNCNQAHEHFLEGEWGDWVLNCFECGRWYYKGVDITED